MLLNTEPSLQVRFRAAFAAGLPIPFDTERHLGEALAETLQRPGNFVRAELAYRVARASGVREEAGMHLATAMEYFHTASLLFDDLPSMDDATHRRGGMCIHHLFGEGPAILTALALVNRAYALLWRAIAQGEPRHAEPALAYAERYLGVGGLLNGQSQDLHYSQLPPSDRSPERIAMGKTASLIRLSLVLPALAGGAGPQAVRRLDRLAILWGLAYQILDDLKDVLHEAGRAGKTTARDALLDRPNLAITLGTDAALERLERLVEVSGHMVAQIVRMDGTLGCLVPPQHRLQHEAEAMAGSLVGAAQ